MQCEDTCIATHRHRDMAASSGPPAGVCIQQLRAGELLVKQQAVSDGQAISPIKQGDKHTQSLNCRPSNLVTCADQVSRVSRVTARYRGVSTLCIGYQEKKSVRGVSRSRYRPGGRRCESCEASFIFQRVLATDRASARFSSPSFRILHFPSYCQVYTSVPKITNTNLL
jgi:hypothetical protein